MLESAARPPPLLAAGLTVGGLVTCLIGGAHAFMPSFGYDDAVPRSMSPAASAHFYYLGTYAICGFLLGFGSLSLYFGRSGPPRPALVVCAVFALFWTYRAVLEVLYPVELRIFFLRSPHGVLLPVTVFLALTYAVAAIAGWRESKSAR